MKKIPMKKKEPVIIYKHFDYGTEAEKRFEAWQKLMYSESNNGNGISTTRAKELCVVAREIVDALK